MSALENISSGTAPYAFQENTEKIAQDAKIISRIHIKDKLCWRKTGKYLSPEIYKGGIGQEFLRSIQIRTAPTLIIDGTESSNYAILWSKTYIKQDVHDRDEKLLFQDALKGAFKNLADTYRYEGGKKSLIAKNYKIASIMIRHKILEEEARKIFDKKIEDQESASEDESGKIGEL